MSDLRVKPSQPIAASPASTPASAAAPVATPADSRVDGFPADQLAAFQARGFLPANFARLDAWDQKSAWRGAQRMQANAWIDQTRQALEPGDVILVHGNDPFITPMDGGAHYIHAAIVSGTDPLTVIEAWGPNDSGKSAVREVPFAEFVDGKPGDGYKVVRPTTDPAIAKQAIAYARQQVGKPYDWSFGLFGPSAGSAWYCSDLVYAAYGAAAGKGANPLAIQKDPHRDQTLATIQDLAGALRLQDPAAMRQLIAMAYMSPLLVGPKHAKYSVDDLTAFLRDRILAKDPVFAPLMRSKAGQQLVLSASTDMMHTFIKTGALSPAAIRQALLGRFAKLSFWQKLGAGFACLRGAVHVRFSKLLQARKALQAGALARTLVAPQDLASGHNASSWRFGAAP